METALLWEEARKALRSSTATRQQYAYRFRVRRTYRELEPRTEAVVREEARISAGFTRAPFVSLPAAELAARGYFETEGDTLVFHAPDAAVLLSDEFLDTHCFRVQRPDREHAGMIGLAFEPTGGAGRPDVQGVLWLDAATAELRLLEYGYRNLPRSVPANLAGGRVAFQRLPNGAWIIPEWRIRMPGAASPAPRRGMPLPGVSSPAPQLGLSEETGEVLEIRTAAGELVSGAAFASVAGTVYDSTRAAPLAGARVRLLGTAHGTTTDSSGAYRITGVSGGVYSLVFSHPRLDTLGYSPEPVHLRLVPPREETQQLALPSMAVIHTASCPRREEGAAALAGTVRGEGERPLPGARVTASWQRPGEAGDSARAIAIADAQGIYRLCSVPSGVQLRLEARLGEGGASVLHRVEGEAPGVRDLAIGAAAPPVQAATVGRSPRVTGRLLDAETGRPVAGATVRFTRGLPEQRTDRRGVFTLTDVPEGSYGLEFQHESYGVGTSRMTVRGLMPLQFDLRVPRRTVRLDPVAVVAERVRPSSFVRARRRRTNYMDRSEIQRRAGARDVGDLVRTFPRLTVREIPYLSNPGMVKEVCVEERSAFLQNDPQICRNVTVVFDDLPIIADVGEFLRDLSLASVESVEYLSAAEAAGVVPYGDGGGVLVIYSRGFEPRPAR